jgi:hypothetical protein
MTQPVASTVQSRPWALAFEALEKGEVRTTARNALAQLENWSGGPGVAGSSPVSPTLVEFQCREHVLQLRTLIGRRSKVASKMKPIA